MPKVAAILLLLTIVSCETKTDKKVVLSRLMTANTQYIQILKDQMWANKEQHKPIEDLQRQIDSCQQAGDSLFKEYIKLTK